MVAFTFYLGAIVNNHDAKRSADFPIVKRAVNRVLRDKNDSWFAKCEISRANRKFVLSGMIMGIFDKSRI